MAQATQSPTYSDDSRKDGEEEKDSYKEYSSEKDLSEEEQAKLVTKLDKMFRYALDHTSWVRGREKMVQCFKYREGEQWTAAELATLEERHQPDTVNNQISVVVNQLIGDLINQRFRTGYRGRNDAQDAEVANVLTDIFLYIRQNNDAEFEERDMADDGFTGGMGVLDVQVTYDDMMQPDIKVRAEDPLIVFPDPDGRRYDWNEDGNFVCRAKWWKLDEAVEFYPHAELGLKGMAGSVASMGEESGSGQLATVDHFKGENYVDKDNGRVRLIEVQYKKQKREQLLLLGTGQSIPFEDKKEIADTIKQADAAQIQHRVISRLKSTICVGVYAAGVLLEHKETDHKFFALVPYFAYRRKTGEPYSLVTLALSMQDAINKRESKALHLLNTNQAIYEKSAVEDPLKTAEEKAKPDGMIEVRDGALANNRFSIKENLELASTQFQMHQRAVADLFSIVGLDPRRGQQTGELRSGAGLQRKYAEASKPVAVLFDNVRRTRKILARVVLDLVQKYFTADKIMLITDDEKKSRLVGMNADVMTRIKTGQYDAVVDEFEDDPTTQDEQFRVFAETLPQLLQFPAPYTQMMVQMSRIRNKAEILQMLQAQQGPAPIQPKMNLQANLDNLDVAERAGVWELIGRKDIADMLRQNPPMTTNEAKLTGQVATEKMKADGNNGQAEQMQTAMEMQQSQTEHELKMQEMTTKHEISIQKHAMDLEKMAMQQATQRKKGEVGG